MQVRIVGLGVCKTSRSRTSPRSGMGRNCSVCENGGGKGNSGNGVQSWIVNAQFRQERFSTGDVKKFYFYGSCYTIRCGFC